MNNKTIFGALAFWAAIIAFLFFGLQVHHANAGTITAQATDARTVVLDPKRISKIHRCVDLVGDKFTTRYWGGLSVFTGPTWEMQINDNSVKCIKISDSDYKSRERPVSPSVHVDPKSDDTPTQDDFSGGCVGKCGDRQPSFDCDGRKFCEPDSKMDPVQYQRWLNARKILGL